MDLFSKKMSSADPVSRACGAKAAREEEHGTVKNRHENNKCRFNKREKGQSEQQINWRREKKQS